MKTQLIALLALLALPAYATTDKKAADGQPAMDPAKAEMMKKYMEASTPGEAHKRLKELEGNWKYTSKMWETAESKPEESKGKTKFKMILGNRFLQQEFKGKAMGMDFEGLGLLGYDNVKKEYQSIWVDTMSTAMMTGTGTYDEAKKVLTETGEYSCPISEDKEQKYRTEWAMTDKKNMTFSMYGKGPKGGKEFKMMEINYTR